MSEKIENPIFMCPKCGSLVKTKEICDYCETQRVQIDCDVSVFNNLSYDEISLMDDRICRKHLFNNPLFDEEIYEARLKNIKEEKEAIAKRHEALIAKEESKRREEEIDENFYDYPPCPFCQSRNLTKISAVGKAAKIATFGILGLDSMSKTYKCNKCGCKF